MKLLVLAQTPPPVHGQSLMVRALVDGLPTAGIEVRHVEMRLSHSSEDIGQWRIGKILEVARAAAAARRIARREACDALYYVPAPAKRGALYRDILAMAICRDRRRSLVLHWHAPGLGAWLATRATALERKLALRALGGADLALILGPELLRDAAAFNPRRVAVLPNGLVDPGPPLPRSQGTPCELLFLGLGSREKGLHDLVDAVALLDARRPGAFRLTFAGGFPSSGEQRDFEDRARRLGDAVRCVGFADEGQKRLLLAASDIFCLPTSYSNEGQPLALIEALAYDLRIVTTRWRAIPGMMPEQGVWYVEPGRPPELAASIESAAAAPSPAGAMRRHYLERFTLGRHLDTLRSALLLLRP